MFHKFEEMIKFHLTILIIFVISVCCLGQEGLKTTDESFRLDYRYFNVFDPVKNEWSGWNEGAITIVLNINYNGDIKIYKSKDKFEVFRRISKVEDKYIPDGLHSQLTKMLDEKGDELFFILWDYGASELAYFNGIVVAFNNEKEWKGSEKGNNEESNLNKSVQSSKNVNEETTERINTEEWSESEINVANTAKYVNYLTEYEKEVIKLINLARLNGRKFLENNFHEYININNSKYTQIDESSTYMLSLKNTLQKTVNLPMLLPNPSLTKMAKFHATDMGKTGKTGHSSSTGESFEQRSNNFWGNAFCGENCSYGFNDPIAIVGQLILDQNVPSLGHRKNILNESYSACGVGIAPHTVWTSNCVIDFSNDINHSNSALTNKKSDNQKSSEKYDQGKNQNEMVVQIGTLLYDANNNTITKVSSNTRVKILNKNSGRKDYWYVEYNGYKGYINLHAFDDF